MGSVPGKEENLEIKINREIRDYTESVFFGLSPRQFFFSLAAVGVAVGLFFILRKLFGTESVSWVCVLGAAPFAALGFFRYHGMTAEQFLWVWIRSEILEPKVYHFRPKNPYLEAAERMKKAEKEKTHFVLRRVKDGQREKPIAEQEGESDV